MISFWKEPQQIYLLPQKPVLLMSRWLSQELRMPSHHVLPVTVNLPLQNVDLPSHRQVP